ncbi:hypothetical protein ABZ816_08375 [Actinosynnema sp. NPDC047251]|nr:hypothetical protein [Saccharothrix espanaensis]
MDAPTAALIGASVGVIGTLAGALINPHTAARHARNMKIIDLRKDAYLECMKVLQKVPPLIRPHEMRTLAREIEAVPVAQMRLFADDVTAEWLGELADILNRAADRIEELGKKSASDCMDDKQIKLLISEWEEGITRFLRAARSDLGIETFSPERTPKSGRTRDTLRANW